ncbi:MAG: hypothetical protein EZS28_053959, partial [Streblomastix strix]
MECGAEATKQPLNENEHIKLWIGYSTACGPFQQIAICKDSTKLWETSIYAREQAVIAANSLSDQCTNNSVSVSPLETVVRGRRHCRIFLDIPAEVFAAGSFNYLIPYPITIAVMDIRFLIRSEGQKPDIIYLLNLDKSAYNAFSVRIVNMEGKDPD